VLAAPWQEEQAHEEQSESSGVRQLAAAFAQASLLAMRWNA